MSLSDAVLLVKERTGCELLEALEMLKAEEFLEDWGPEVCTAYHTLMASFTQMFHG